MAASLMRGGRREGAGRKPGSKTKKTQLLAEAAREAGISPLEYMLTVLRDPKAETERRDEMAKAAAPYIHPRLSNVEAKIDISGHEAALAEIEEHAAVLSLPSPPLN
jgi:hypothetical protein